MEFEQPFHDRCAECASSVALKSNTLRVTEVVGLCPSEVGDDAPVTRFVTQAEI